MKNLTAVQQQRRERILFSAREQLSRLGYDGLNMRDLAVVADVSTSTLYNLYQSKDTLILAALEDRLQDLDGKVVASSEPGLERCLKRFELVAEQIIETPQYASAMGTMLFNAQASDPIVKVLLGASLALYTTELKEMRAAGDLREDADIRFIARSLASTGWSAMLMWMKGFVALHDFRDEYIRNSCTVLLPWLNPAAEEHVRAMI